MKRVKPVIGGTIAHQKLREQLQKDIDEFLENGGVITIIDPGVQKLIPVVEIIEEACGKITKRVTSPVKFKMFSLYDRGDFFFDVEDVL